MSKANSHGKSTGNGSAQNASVSATKHHRRPRKNSHFGVGTDQAADAVAERSTARDYAGTTHSQATNGPRRDQPPPCPSRVFYENTYRIEPQVHCI